MKTISKAMASEIKTSSLWEKRIWGYVKKTVVQKEKEKTVNKKKHIK